MTPEVSIVLPVYNRAHTVGRALDSVLAQTFGDFELIVVNDGSTDATAEFDTGADPRVRWVHQENQGLYPSRNRGLELSRGRLITFLDSDDEWLPHSLGLAVSFLQAFRDDHVVISEFITDESPHPALWLALVHTHLPNARRIGSSSLDLPPGTDDDYLRLYSTREEFGGWATPWLPDDPDDDAALYRGDISKGIPYGYLAWMPSLVMTRHALETVGTYEARWRSGEDYLYTSKLIRRFRMNLISQVAARKHELAPDGSPLDHLAIGPSMYRTDVHCLEFFDRLFEGDDDPDIALVRRRREYEAGITALQLGLRDEAMQHFGRSAGWDHGFWRGHLMRALAFASGTGPIAQGVYGGARRAIGALRRVLPV